MSDGNVTNEIELVPFDEARAEMLAGPPRNSHVPLWVSELPLLVAVAGLFALYLAG